MERDDVIAVYGTLVMDYLDRLVTLAKDGQVNTKAWKYITDKLVGAQIRIDEDTDEEGHLTAYDFTGVSIWTIS